MLCHFTKTDRKFTEPPTEPPLIDDCVAEPTQCLKAWKDKGFPIKGEEGKKEALVYRKCTRKKRNQILGKKPKNSKRSAPSPFLPRGNQNSCKWTDCTVEHVVGKTWADFDKTAWSKCTKRNMKYMKKGK